MTEELDLVEITASYLGDKTQPPFHSAMMAAVLLYGYCCGISSRAGSPAASVLIS